MEAENNEIEEQDSSKLGAQVPTIDKKHLIKIRIKRLVIVLCVVFLLVYIVIPTISYLSESTPLSRHIDRRSHLVYRSIRGIISWRSVAIDSDCYYGIGYHYYSDGDEMLYCLHGIKHIVTKIGTVEAKMEIAELKESSLREGEIIKGMVCFYNDRNSHAIATVEFDMKIKSVHSVRVEFIFNGIYGAYASQIGEDFLEDFSKNFTYQGLDILVDYIELNDVSAFGMN